MGHESTVVAYVGTGMIAFGAIALGSRRKFFEGALKAVPEMTGAHLGELALDEVDLSEKAAETDSLEQGGIDG